MSQDVNQDKLVAIKIAEQGKPAGQYHYIPIYALAQNVYLSEANWRVDAYDLETIIGSPDIIDPTNKGSLQEQINNLAKNKIDQTQMKNFAKDQMHEEIQEWLTNNIDGHPEGQVILVNASLTVQGQAADAKVTGDQIRSLKAAIGFDEIEKDSDENVISSLQNQINNKANLEQVQSQVQSFFSEELQNQVVNWLENKIEIPEDGVVLVDRELNTPGQAADAAQTGGRITALENEFAPAATNKNIGNVLKAKTITNGRVSAWELGLPQSINGFEWNLLNNTGGLTDDDIHTFGSIVYSDQANMNNGLLTMYARQNSQTLISVPSQIILYDTGFSPRDLSNKQYTFSFEVQKFLNYLDPVKTEDLENGFLDIQYGYRDFSKTDDRTSTSPFDSTYDKFSVIKTIQTTNESDEWKKYYIHINLPNDLDGQGNLDNFEADFRFGFAFKLEAVNPSKKGYSFRIKNFKLEQGDTPTTWTPSVTDLQLGAKEQRTIYTHIGYCNDPISDLKIREDNKGTFVGLYFDENSTKSDEVKDYTWFSVDGDSNADDRRFTWNILKEQDINSAIPNDINNNTGMSFSYQGNGWFKVFGTPSSSSSDEGGIVYFPLFSKSIGIIALDSSSYCLSVEIDDDLIRNSLSSDSMISGLYFMYGTIASNGNINFGSRESIALSSDYKAVVINKSASSDDRVLVEIGYFYDKTIKESYDGKIRLMLSKGASPLSWSPNPKDLYGYRVSLSTESYVFPKTTESQTIITTIQAYKGNESIPVQIIGSLSGVPNAGMNITYSKDRETNKQIQITVNSSSIPSTHGIIMIPVRVGYQEYNLSFTYAISQNGLDNIYYAECKTASSQATKEIVCANQNFTSLSQGMLFLVKFTNMNNSADALKLKISHINNEIHAVYFNNQSISSDNRFGWAAGSKILFMYDGSNFAPVGYPNTYYGNCTTKASAAEKTFAIANFVLCKGTNVVVHFTKENTAKNPSLKISSIGGYSIQAKNANLSAKHYWNTDATVSFTFNGTTFELDNSVIYDKLHNISYGNENNKPTNGGNAGDLYINSSQGNRIEYWNGSSWNSLQIGSGAIATGAINESHIKPLINGSIVDSTGGIDGSLIKNTLASSNNSIIMQVGPTGDGYLRSQNQSTDDSVTNYINIKKGELSSVKIERNKFRNDTGQFSRVEYSPVVLTNEKLEFRTPHSTIDGTAPIAVNNTIPTRSAQVWYDNANTNDTYSDSRFVIKTEGGDPIYLGSNDSNAYATIGETSIFNGQVLVKGRFHPSGNIQLHGQELAKNQTTYLDFHTKNSPISDFDTRLASVWERNASGLDDTSKPQFMIQVRSGNSTAFGFTAFKSGGIELYPKFSEGQGGAYIDFHFNGETSKDYTARIRESTSGKIQVRGNLEVAHIADNDSYGNLNVVEKITCKTLNQTSDERLKKDIIDIDNQYLTLLDNLDVKQFRFKQNDKKINIGFIAQDVLKLIEKTNIKDQSFVDQTSFNEEEKYYTVNYIEFIPLLVKKCQQQDKKIQELEKKINNIKKYEQ